MDSSDQPQNVRLLPAVSMASGPWPGTRIGNMSRLAKSRLAYRESGALIARLPTSFDDRLRQVVYELTQTLITSRRVPEGGVQLSEYASDYRPYS